MRPIEFRGKRLDNGEWAKGSLILTMREDTKVTRAFILSPYAGGMSGDVSKSTLNFMPVEVDPATVGQFTGLTDKNGRKIYEGDIVNLLGECRREVIFKEGVFGYASILDEAIALGLNYNFKWIDGRSAIVEVVGNIHDNPLP
jgi:uncharacterized phage protein (TIGR01671 family)